MPALTAADFDVASLLTNVGLAGAALLTVAITVMGFRRIVAFFR